MANKEVLKEKEKISAEIKDRFSKATSAVIVDYLGLSVSEATEMRAKLREAGVDYKIYKNTLAKRALEGSGKDELIEHLKGSSAFAFSYDDVTAPMRIIYQTMKSTEKMKFKAGIVDGAIVDEQELISLASIPSREVLLAKLLGSLKAPISAFARVINEIAKAKGSGEEEAAEAKTDVASEEKPADKPEDKPADDSAEKPADKPAEKTDESANESANESEKTDTVAENNSEAPANKPAEGNDDKPKADSGDTTEKKDNDTPEVKAAGSKEEAKDEKQADKPDDKKSEEPTKDGE